MNEFLGCPVIELKRTIKIKFVKKVVNCKFWKELKEGDILDLVYVADYFAGRYAPEIQIVKNGGEEFKTTSKLLVKKLSNYEFEYI